MSRFGVPWPHKINRQVIFEAAKAHRGNRERHLETFHQFQSSPRPISNGEWLRETDPRVFLAEAKSLAALLGDGTSGMEWLESGIVPFSGLGLVVSKLTPEDNPPLTQWTRLRSICA